MSANPDEQHQRQIQARIDACQSELGNLEAEQQRLADRYATLKARINALREELQPSHCQAEPFDQWSADVALAEKRGGAAMMLDANDPNFAARYPYGAIVRDRWGRRIPGVMACNPETGEVISYNGTWLTGQWLRLTRGIRVAVVTRHALRWVSPSGGLLRCHGFWPAPLTIEGKRPEYIRAERGDLPTRDDFPPVSARGRCSLTPLTDQQPAHFAAIRDRIADGSDRLGELTLAQLDDMILAVERNP